MSSDAPPLSTWQFSFRRWRELLVMLPLAVCLPTSLASKAGEPTQSCASAIVHQNCLLIPGDGAQVCFRVTRTGEPLEFEFGYTLLDNPQGSVTNSRNNLGRRRLQLSGDGGPEKLVAGTPAFLNHLLRDGHAVCVVPRTQSQDGCFTTAKLAIPGDRWLAWYFVPSADLSWCRYCAPEDRPRIYTAVDPLTPNQRSPFHWIPANAGRAPMLKLEFSSNQSSSGPSPRDVSVSVRTTQICIELMIEPLAMEDTYAVFPSGQNFQGPPQELIVAGQSQVSQSNCGLLYNDCSFNGQPLRVTHCRVETPGLLDSALETGPWHELRPSNEPAGNPLSTVTISENEHVHGTLKLYSDGAFNFKPDPSDAYWGPQATEPLPITMQYRLSDGISEAVGRMHIGHGFYQRGEAIDKQCYGTGQLFLAGGGDGRHYIEGRQRFFSESSAKRDIVLISQASENQEFADLVFDKFAGGRARSITSFNITTREQADDQRIADWLAGADVVWLGGGSQSSYLDFWKDTRVSHALNAQASKGASIGATSSGTAVLGQAAYVNLPWDSVTSGVVLRDPCDERNRVLFHPKDGLPLPVLSSDVGSPLHGYLVDTHFEEADRFGRLGVFVARHRQMRGLGIDAGTALLIDKVHDRWRWDVYGVGAVYILESNAALADGKSTIEDSGAITNAITYIRINNRQSVDPSELSKLDRHSIHYDGQVLYRPAKEHLYLREP